MGSWTVISLSDLGVGGAVASGWWGEWRFLDFLVKSPLLASSLIPISNTWQDLIFLGQHETVLAPTEREQEKQND